MSRKSIGGNAERELLRILQSDGWLVVRSAGSKGTADIYAVKKFHDDITNEDKYMPLLIEVKSTSKQAWSAKYRDREKEQFDDYVEMYKRYGIPILYFIRHRDRADKDKWYVIIPDYDNEPKYPFFRVGKNMTLKFFLEKLNMAQGDMSAWRAWESEYEMMVRLSGGEKDG